MSERLLDHIIDAIQAFEIAKEQHVDVIYCPMSMFGQLEVELGIRTAKEQRSPAESERDISSVIASLATKIGSRGGLLYLFGRELSMYYRGPLLVYPKPGWNPVIWVAVEGGPWWERCTADIEPQMYGWNGYCYTATGKQGDEPEVFGPGLHGDKESWEYAHYDRALVLEFMRGFAFGASSRKEMNT